MQAHKFVVTCTYRGEVTDAEYTAANVDGLPFLSAMMLTVFLFNTVLLGLCV